MPDTSFSRSLPRLYRHLGPREEEGVIEYPVKTKDINGELIV